MNPKEFEQAVLLAQVAVGIWARSGYKTPEEFMDQALATVELAHQKIQSSEILEPSPQ